MMKVNVKGVICSNDEKWIYDLFEIDSTSPKDVIDSLNEANGEDVEVIVNSGGGSVFDGSEMYTELREYPGNVEVKIVGLAASAASFIAMAGDKVRISPTAQVMIHNASAITAGDYNEMDKMSDMLKNTNKAISSAYRMKSGMSEDELLDLMNKETWLNAQDAKEKGLVDEVMFEEPNIKLAASSSVGNMIPQKVIDGIRQMKQKPTGIDKQTLDDALANMKQDILNELKQNNEPPEPVNNWLF